MAMIAARSTSPAAIATFNTVPAVIGSAFAVPRMPSVPNNLRAIAPLVFETSFRSI